MVARFTESDDGSFLATESEFSGPDIMLRFGPLQTPLSKLMADGWDLRCWGLKGSGQLHRVRLCRDKEAYTVGRATVQSILQSRTMICFVKKTPFVGQILNLPDPWAFIQARYPKKPKTPMIGNRPAREYILELLSDFDAF